MSASDSEGEEDGGWCNLIIYIFNYSGDELSASDSEGEGDGDDSRGKHALHSKHEKVHDSEHNSLTKIFKVQYVFIMWCMSSKCLSCDTVHAWSTCVYHVFIMWYVHDQQVFIM